MTTAGRAYEIDKILDEATIESKPHYLIKWKGYSSVESTWEPIQNLMQSLNIVHAWKVGQNRNAALKERVTEAEGKNKARDRRMDQVETGSGEIEHGRLRKRRKREVLLEEDDFSSASPLDAQDKVVEMDQLDAEDSYQLAMHTRSREKHSPYKKSTSTKTPDNNPSRKKKPSEKQTDVNGFKVIGKITKEAVKSVIWCFDWQGKKICQVELRDGRKVNMKRDDLKTICPEKLLEYHEKLEKSKL